MVATLLAWSFYRRVRRNIGRQKLQSRRIIFRMLILGLASCFILAGAYSLPLAALGFAGGALAGALLSLLGLRHTKFDTTPEGHFYTPNTYIGLALSFLLLGRIAYRMLMWSSPSGLAGQPDLFHSPLTLVLVGVTVGYYLGYYTGLFVHTHDKN